MTVLEPFHVPVPEEKIIYQINEECFLLYNEDNILVLVKSVPLKNKKHDVIDVRESGLIGPHTNAVIVKNPVKDHLVFCNFSEHVTAWFKGDLQIGSVPDSVVVVR